MAVAPGSSGEWVYLGNGQWGPARFDALRPGEFGQEGTNQWISADGSVPTGMASNIGGSYGGTRDQIYQSLFGQSPDALQSRFGTNFDPYLGQAIEGTQDLTVGQGRERIGSKPLLAALEAQGYDWRNDPSLVSYDQQATANAQQVAEGRDKVNTKKMTAAELAMAAASVWGGGYLMGTGLGAAQGLGSFGSLLTNPGLTGANLGAGAGLGEASLLGAGAAENTFLGSGGGMDFMDFLDFGSNFGASGEGMFPTGMENFAGAWDVPAGGGLEDYFSDFGSNFGPSGEGMYPTGAEDFPGAWPGTSQTDWMKTLQDSLKMPGSGGSNILKSLMGGDGQGGYGVNPRGGGGFLDSLLGGISNNAGSLLGLAPILGGLAYGYNQTGFDTGRLENLYDQYNPQAQAYLYDQNTLKGRDALTSGLNRRNVFGSFANNDLTNYNTQRDLGRQSLIQNAIPGQAGIAGQIQQSNIAERALKNDLIGKGLGAIGTMFSGRRAY